MKKMNKIYKTSLVICLLIVSTTIKADVAIKGVATVTVVGILDGYNEATVIVTCRGKDGTCAIIRTKSSDDLNTVEVSGEQIMTCKAYSIKTNSSEGYESSEITLTGVESVE